MESETRWRPARRAGINAVEAHLTARARQFLRPPALVHARRYGPEVGQPWPRGIRGGFPATSGHS